MANVDTSCKFCEIQGKDGLALAKKSAVKETAMRGSRRNMG